jgi:hypothetical protein
VPVTCNIYVPTFDFIKNATVFNKQTYTFTDFHETNAVALDHDISECGSGINKQFFVFNVTTKLDKKLIQSRLLSFSHNLLKEINFKLRVPQIRITNLKVILIFNFLE